MTERENITIYNLKNQNDFLQDEKISSNRSFFYRNKFKVIFGSIAFTIIAITFNFYKDDFGEKFQSEFSGTNLSVNRVLVEGSSENIDINTPIISGVKTLGSKSGKLITALPITDLAKPNGGAFNVKEKNIKLDKAGKLIDFEGEKVLSVFYEKGTGTSGMKKPKLGRFDFTAVPQGLPALAAVIKFDVYFAPGWNFSRGGKLGGLAVGHGKASGYVRSHDGASHRMMWKHDGGAISYVYPPKDLKQEIPGLEHTEHGHAFFHHLFPSGTLKIGKWHTVEIGIKLNSFKGSKPNANGESYLAIDGVTGHLNNIRWRKFQDIKITKFSFSSFFGGPAPALTDCYAYFKNYELREWKD